MKWYYTIKCIRKISSREDGKLWSEMLPDELFAKHFVFDGWEASYNHRREIQTYELFWYPKTFEDASEVYAILNSLKDHTLIEGCKFQFRMMRAQ